MWIKARNLPWEIGIFKPYSETRYVNHKLCILCSLILLSLVDKKKKKKKKRMNRLMGLRLWRIWGLARNWQVSPRVLLYSLNLTQYSRVDKQNESTYKIEVAYKCVCVLFCFVFCFLFFSVSDMFWHRDKLMPLWHHLVFWDMGVWNDPTGL